jgi:ATP-dependent DNA helicase RecQ
MISTQTPSHASSDIDVCEQLAQTHFGIPKLRPLQKKALSAILETPGGVLATLPTGAGKTLLYALPALLFQDEHVLVVCPLISLMRDQVRRLEAANISCAVFTSDQSERERGLNLELLTCKRARVVFASPERLMLPSFVRMLMRLKIALVVVDEAHCVVTWGPSFRPEYAELKNLMNVLKPPRILAITATASRAGRTTIREKVFPLNVAIQEVIAPPIRENIVVECIRTRTEQEKWDTLTTRIHAAKAKRAIVYFTRRNLCTEAATALRKKGLHAVAYHAGLTKEERLSVETYAHESQERVVICATQAFGMGIDLAGVTLVAVFGFPSSVEEFFQMIGRAGRGGETARALLLWTGADPKKRYFQFETSFPSVKTISEYISDLERAFPIPPSKRIVSHDSIKNHIRIPAAKLEQRLPGVFTALRMLGALDMPLANEHYLTIKLAKNTSAQDLLLDLPNTPTRRGRLMNRICELNGSDWRKQPGAESCHPAGPLLDSARLTWPQCEEILLHFAQKKLLTWEIANPQQLQGQWIIKGSPENARSALHTYERTRADFLQSLTELERLANQTHCRLRNISSFFGDGVKNRSNAKCMQCDLCLQTQESHS